MSVLLTLSSKDKSLTFHKINHFGHLYLESNSFGHYPTLMIISVDSNKNWYENRKLCFCTELSFQYKWFVKLAHYRTCFSNTCVQFVVLSTITRECDSKVLKLLRLLESNPFVWKEHWTGCLDKHMISFLAVLIFIPSSKQASENRSSAYWRSPSSLTMQGHLQIAGAEHYTFQMWHHYWRNYLSLSCPCI